MNRALRVFAALLLHSAGTAAEWKLFLRQTAGLWQDADKWVHCTAPPCGADEMAPNYSILDQLETCRTGGVFIFKVLWPKGDNSGAEPSHNIWRQSSNPLKVGPTEGYVPIDVQRPERDFGGLTYGMSKNNHQAALCNKCDPGNWWHALGAVAGPCGAKFPGADCTDVAELWAECGSDWGWPFIAFVLGAGAVYVGAPVSLATRTRGAPRGELLAAHPHYQQWMQVHAMVHDGVAFVRGGAGRRGGRGYSSVGGSDTLDDSHGRPTGKSSSKRSSSRSSKSKDGGKAIRRNRDDDSGSDKKASAAKEASASAEQPPALAPAPAAKKVGGYRGDEWSAPKVTLSSGARETGAKVKY